MSPLLTCGSTALTGVSGSFAERSQMHRLQSGLYRVVMHLRAGRIAAHDSRCRCRRVRHRMLLGAVWDESDTIGAITTGMWALSIALLIVVIGVFVMRRRNPSVTAE
jgi:hypothetical protein